MGGKAKPIKQTPEEKALMRAQLLALDKQDTEINERKRRILRGQYASFGGLLKGGGIGGLGKGVNAGTGGGRVGFGGTPSGGVAV